MCGSGEPLVAADQGLPASFPDGVAMCYALGMATTSALDQKPYDLVPSSDREPLGSVDVIDRQSGRVCGRVVETETDYFDRLAQWEVWAEGIPWSVWATRADAADTLWALWTDLERRSGWVGDRDRVLQFRSGLVFVCHHPSCSGSSLTLGRSLDDVERHGTQEHGASELDELRRFFFGFCDVRAQAVPEVKR